MDPESVSFVDVSIDTITHAYMTVKMPAEIGMNQCGSLICKVDTGVISNVSSALSSMVRDALSSSHP